jgi:hypothetical protein
MLLGTCSLLRPGADTASCLQARSLGKQGAAEQAKWLASGFLQGMRVQQLARLGPAKPADRPAQEGGQRAQILLGQGQVTGRLCLRLLCILEPSVGLTGPQQWSSRSRSREAVLCQTSKPAVLLVASVCLHLIGLAAGSYSSAQRPSQLAPVGGQTYSSQHTWPDPPRQGVAILPPTS